MKISSDNIQSLKPNEVFVYGANEAGLHGAGAAFHANKLFGAKWGEYGFNGQSYGIPTKDKRFRVLSLERIQEHVNDFIKFVQSNPDKEFLLTEIGCGLAGYTPEQIAPLFWRVADCSSNICLDNIHYPERFALELRYGSPL